MTHDCLMDDRRFRRHMARYEIQRARSMRLLNDLAGAARALRRARLWRVAECGEIDPHRPAATA